MEIFQRVMRWQSAREEMAADREQMLAHQLPSLPPFESFWNELPGFVAWLEERTPNRTGAVSVGTGRARYSPRDRHPLPSPGTAGVSSRTHTVRLRQPALRRSRLHDARRWAVHSKDRGSARGDRSESRRGVEEEPRARAAGLRCKAAQRALFARAGGSTRGRGDEVSRHVPAHLVPGRHRGTPRRGAGVALGGCRSRGRSCADLQELLERQADRGHEDRKGEKHRAVLPPSRHIGEEPIADRGERRAVRGNLIDPRNFRNRVFRPLVALVAGRARRFTPHGLRHTFASPHMARGTPLLWIQQQGGWASARCCSIPTATSSPQIRAGIRTRFHPAPDGRMRPSAPKARPDRIVIARSASGKTEPERHVPPLYPLGAPRFERGTPCL